jgi:hypothetical protein
VFHGGSVREQRDVELDHAGTLPAIYPNRPVGASWDWYRLRANPPAGHVRRGVVRRCAVFGLAGQAVQVLSMLCRADFSDDCRVSAQ